jgi:hypothetical protein
MVKKLVRCPICDAMVPLEVDSKLIKNAKRFPFTTKIDHDDHYFYINMDSRGSITDVLHPDLVE